MDNSRDPVIHVFYRPEQVLAIDSPENFSKSPQKPRLLLGFLSRTLVVLVSRRSRLSIPVELAACQAH
jgi:hypothetical protein